MLNMELLKAQYTVRNQSLLAKLQASLARANLEEFMLPEKYMSADSDAEVDDDENRKRKMQIDRLQKLFSDEAMMMEKYHTLAQKVHSLTLENKTLKQQQIEHNTKGCKTCKKLLFVNQRLVEKLEKLSEMQKENEE